MILNGENDTHHIITYGIGLRGQRFSKLSSINSSNVRDLVPAPVLFVRRRKAARAGASRWSSTASYSRLSISRQNE
jgi:hypothetical protein